MTKRWVRVGLINLAILLAGIMLAEFVFGNWIFGPHLGYLTIPRGVMIRHDVTPVDPGGGIATYTRDKYGLRGDYGEDPANIDMLVMGGSTTNELYVSDEKTWVAQLDKLLAEGGYKITAINAGIDGHSSIAHIRAFDAWLPQIPQLHPKYFLFYLGINEPVADALLRYDYMEAHGFWARLARTFKNNSAVYNLYRIVRGSLRAQAVHAVHESIDLSAARMTAAWDGNPARVAPIVAAWKDRLDAYESRAKKLIELVRARGATPIFVTQLRGDSRRRGAGLIGLSEAAIDGQIVLGLFDAVTLKVCREARGICIDLANRFDTQDGDFYDDTHVVASGSRKVAQIVYDGLKTSLSKPR